MHPFAMALLPVLAEVAHWASWESVCALRRVCRAWERAVQSAWEARALLVWAPEVGLQHWRARPRTLSVCASDSPLVLADIPACDSLVLEDFDLRNPLPAVSRLCLRECVLADSLVWPQALRVLTLRTPLCSASLDSLPPTLHTLRLENCTLDLDALSGLPPLTSLTLEHCAAQHRHGWLSLAALPASLRRLHVESTAVSGLDRLPAIRVLSVHNWLSECAPTDWAVPATVDHLTLALSAAGDDALPPSVCLPPQVRTLTMAGYWQPRVAGALPALTTLHTGNWGVSSQQWRLAPLALGDWPVPALRVFVAPRRSASLLSLAGAPLTYLVPPRTWHGSLDQLPRTLEVLDIQHSYTTALPIGDWLPALRALSLGDAFNSPLCGLPGDLRRLVLGNAFDQALGVLPANLCTLVLGARFAQSLVALPESMEELVIGNLQWREPTATPTQPHCDLRLPRLRTLTAARVVLQTYGARCPATTRLLAVPTRGFEGVYAAALRIHFPLRRQDEQEVDQ